MCLLFTVTYDQKLISFNKKQNKTNRTDPKLLKGSSVYNQHNNFESKSA